MLRSFSSNAQKCKKKSEPSHVGIHKKALAEYYQMSTHVPGFQAFLSFFSSFDIDQGLRKDYKELFLSDSPFAVIDL